MTEEERKKIDILIADILDQNKNQLNMFSKKISVLSGKSSLNASMVEEKEGTIIQTGVNKLEGSSTHDASTDELKSETSFDGGENMNSASRSLN